MRSIKVKRNRSLDFINYNVLDSNCWSCIHYKKTEECKAGIKRWPDYGCSKKEAVIKEERE